MAYNATLERDEGTIALVSKQLESIYNDAREQSRAWFHASLVAALIGFLMVGLGVVFAASGFMETGLLTAIASLIPQVAAALFFRQGSIANKRVDDIRSRLMRAHELQASVEIADSIEDQKLRDRVKAGLSQKNFGLKGTTNGLKK